MATENKKYIPTFRFPEFQNDGKWKEYPLGQIFSRITKRNSVNNQNVLTISAQYGLISQYDYFNKNVAAIDVSNYYHISKYDFAYNKSKSQGYPYGAIKPLKLYEDGVVSPLYICFRIKDDRSFVNTFFEYYFESGLIHKEIDKISQEGARNHGLLNISTKDFFDKIILYIPSFWEQKKIADCLVSIDKEIDAAKRKLDLLKEHKKGLMQRLFPAKGKTIPELRFPEFKNDGEWQIVSLGEITSVVKRRNKSNRSLPIYSINNAEGFVPQSQQFAGMDSEARGYDISAYKIIGKHTFAYNPARINVGSIGYSGELKDILISSLYVCFKAVENVDDDFLMCFFNSYIFNQAVESNVEGGIRSYLFYENFSRISIAIPSLYEQKRIASCVTSIEDMIKKSNEQISLLETHKKGLLQQLFPMIK